jgi:hypothetical protein
MKKSFFIILIIGIITGFFLRDILREKPASAKLITIRDRNLVFQVATKARTVGEVLEEQGFTTVSPALVGGEEGEGVAAGMVIEVLKPVHIVLVDAGNKREIVTQAITVGDLLNQEKIGLAATDRVNPTLDSYLGEGTKIVIDRIVDLEVVEVHDIPFEITLVDDPDNYYGREEVVTRGVIGKKEQTFLITYKNGIETKRKLLQSKILGKPSQETRKFGTKIEIEERTEGRASWYAYKKCDCAAHPFYEKGRYVRVTSLSSGKSIIVKINDQGPDLAKHPDRIIDLDSVAFKKLAPLQAGTIGVRVELLEQ